MTARSDCLAFTGCDWCESKDKNDSGICYDLEKMPPHPCNNSGNRTVKRCDSAILGNRNCSSFHSCYACLASFPGTSGSQCSWCLYEGCRHFSFSCAPKVTTQIQCIGYKCEASSCDTCSDDSQCMWTKYFMSTAETFRAYDGNGKDYNWNCFRRSIEYRNGTATYLAMDKDTCPALCSSYPTCHSCLGSTGKPFFFYGLFARRCSRFLIMRLNSHVNRLDQPMVCCKDKLSHFKNHMNNSKNSQSKSYEYFQK